MRPTGYRYFHRRGHANRQRGVVLFFALIALAIAGRLIPHPDNFTPVAAMALFAGALLPGWRASAAVLTALVVSDVLLGFAPDVFSVAVYAGFLASIALGRWLGAQRTVLKTASAAIGGSLIFFIITNSNIYIKNYSKFIAL